jgi:pimeloyl-ACP methyl ester carboxylesterase
MPKVQANGITLYYEVHGTGDPLILISGMSYDHWQWHKMTPDLAQHFQVIVFDSRGVGESDKPAGPYTAQLLADDTAALLEALGHRQAFVLGHSMGGFIAQALALSRPELVGKLILASTDFGGPHHIPVTQEALAILTNAQLDPYERMRRGVAVSTAPGWAESHADFIQEWLDYRLQHPADPVGYQAQLAIGLALQSMSEDDCFEHKLERLEMPTLILWGADDKVVPPGNADLLAQRIPSSTIHILPNAGHLFPFEVPEEANEAIVKFLKG